MAIVVLNGEEVELMEAEHRIIRESHKQFQRIRHRDLKENTALKRFEFLFEKLDAITAEIERDCKLGLDKPRVRKKVKALHKKAKPLEEEIQARLSMLISHHGEFRRETSPLLAGIDTVANRVNPWLDKIREQIALLEGGAYEMKSDGTIQTDGYGKPLRKNAPRPRYGVIGINDI